MTEQEVQGLVDDVKDLIEQNARGHIANLLTDLHPADIADLLDKFSEENRRYIFELLDTEVASDVILEVEDAHRESLLERMDEHRLSEIVEEMDSDDATDIVGELPSDVAEAILESIDKQDSDEVKELLKYPEESAGGIMALEFVSVQQTATVAEAIEQIRKAAEEISEIYNVYVTDEHGILTGVLPLRQLIISSPTTKISAIMETDVMSVTSDMDQEEVANIVGKYDLVAVPVVNNQGNLVGRITIDDIIDVLEEEVSEDISKMVGTDEEEIGETSALKVAGWRLPWIITSLCGGVLSGIIISRFKETLGPLLALAFFIPVITAMGGNIGLQSSSMTVRGLATGEIDMHHLMRRLWRELRIGILMGIICGGAVSLVVFLWLRNELLGIIVGGAMFCAITVAATLGILVPIFFNKLKVDPALASGPFVTMSNDITGLVIYFGLASLLLKWTGVG
ncbi:MAG: magnesium transporter [Gemmatimonadota bacterium]|nr:MAG: magnesium transporter [Gemmatimonadota bacterium]